VGTVACSPVAVTVSRSSETAGHERDLFLELLEWVVARSRNGAEIRAFISDDTLQRWRRGDYPKARRSTALDAVDRWARERLKGDYPPAWAPGGLPALALRRDRGDTPADTGPVLDGKPPIELGPTERSERTNRWRLALLAIGIAVAATVAVGSWVLVHETSNDQQTPGPIKLDGSNLCRWHLGATPPVLSTAPLRVELDDRCNFPSGADPQSDQPTRVYRDANRSRAFIGQVRDDTIGNGPTEAATSTAASTPRSRSRSPWPPASRCAAAAFNASSSASLCADPTCSISREPRRDEYTICTAVAPDAVRTVRTYATNRHATASA
jgi:hypothetical protein